MTSASDIAKYILKFFQDCGDPITNLKLQKLLYYVQGWHLALYDEPAFSDPLEAWVHGPVQPDIYQQYKKFRWNPITDEICAPKISKKLQQHIDEVLEVYGVEPAYALEQMTHQELPWKLARNGLPSDMESTAEIKFTTMKDFFRQMSNEQN